MLREVLHAIETADGPVHVATLSQRLGIERTALEGMIAYWVRKGRLQESDGGAESAPLCSHCGMSCASVHDCPFVARMPKSYTVQSSKIPQERT